MDISISIVSYNTKELLEKCIASIYKFTKGVKFEVIVVDNGSNDQSSEMISKSFPKVKLIKNPKNKYFTKANNQALKIANGKYFLILNSDTFFIDNSIKKLAGYMNENKNIGAVDGLEIFEDGKIMKSGSLFSTPLIDFYELSYIGKVIANKKLIGDYRLINYSRKNEFLIDVGCDAFLCTRTDLLRKIGGYDEKLLLYYTENDLCMRIKKEGYDIKHYPNAKVIHKVSVSVNKLGWRRYDIYYKDLLNFYKKENKTFQAYALYYLLKIEKNFYRLKQKIV